MCVRRGNSCPATSRAFTLDQPSVHATLGFAMEINADKARSVGVGTEKQRAPFVLVLEMRVLGPAERARNPGFCNGN